MMRDALRNLEDIEGYELLQGWRTYGTSSDRAFKCRLTSAHPELGICGATDWFVRVSSAYPRGTIDFLPAKVGGIESTYPHQNYNHVGDQQVPWRTGKICLSTPLRTLGRQVADAEPDDALGRLRWHTERALDWLARAAQGDLLQPGDRFELPHLPTSSIETVVFGECQDTFETWQNSQALFGQALLLKVQSDAPLRAVDAFHADRRGVACKYDWGEYIQSHRTDAQKAGWIRLSRIPVIENWRLPATWGELRRVLSAQNSGQRHLLQSAIHDLRDGEVHLLLIGFPIPDRVGLAPCRYHWLAVRLPVLAHELFYQDGFRPNDRGYFTHDLFNALKSDRRVQYLDSENWNKEQTKTRGCLGPNVTNSSFCILGAGALGSTLSELLVRAGCDHVRIVDRDIVKVGNLARHTLTIGEVESDKTSRLAARLNSVSPSAQVSVFNAHVDIEEDSWHDPVEKSDAVIDCTGDDDALIALGGHQCDGEKLFFSVSVGYAARRMFVFAAKGTKFPSVEFREEISPWLSMEQDEMRGEELPWEGIGCYHPVFPARCDDIWLWASIALKRLEKALSDPPTTFTLWVYELDAEKLGVREVNLDDATNEKAESCEVC